MHFYDCAGNNGSFIKKKDHPTAHKTFSTRPKRYN